MLFGISKNLVTKSAKSFPKQLVVHSKKAQNYNQREQRLESI
jgi:hypothetical protein